jgi:hypothetical protein
LQHRINITRVTHSAHAVDYEGERIGQWRVPSCEAARWLLAHGKAERADTLLMAHDGAPALRGGIGWLADRTVAENDKIGPRWSKWQPFAGLPSEGAPRCAVSVAGGQVGKKWSGYAPCCLTAPDGLHRGPSPPNPFFQL